MGRRRPVLTIQRNHNTAPGTVVQSLRCTPARPSTITEREKQAIKSGDHTHGWVTAAHAGKRPAAFDVEFGVVPVINPFVQERYVIECPPKCIDFRAVQLLPVEQRVAYRLVKRDVLCKELLVKMLKAQFWMHCRRHTVIDVRYRSSPSETEVQAPVVVEIGAGTAIPSVRHFSQRVIHEFGGRLIRINPRESSVPTPFDVGFAAGAVETLRAIDTALASQRDR